MMDKTLSLIAYNGSNSNLGLITMIVTIGEGACLLFACLS